jgi:hypothetical protein
MYSEAHYAGAEEASGESRLRARCNTVIVLSFDC